jgi:hypothetical protein
MSEQVLVALLLVMIAVVLLLTVVVILLVYRLFKPAPPAETSPQPPARPSIEDLKKQQSAIKDHNLSMCFYHPEERARGICAIASEPLCEHCLRENDGIVVGPEYFRTLIENEWFPIETILTTPDSTEASAHLYDFKQEQWKIKKRPMFISTHYKINVNDDFIESHVSLNVISNESDLILNELQQYKLNTGIPS